VELNKVFGRSDNKCIQLDNNLTPCCCLVKKWGPG